MTEKIFTEDIDIPEIVLDKTEAAFAEIKRERLYDMNNADKKRKHSFFKNRAAAAVACIAIIGAGGLTAYAAANHFWSEGLKSEVVSDESQQAELENAGALSYLENADGVSVDGITVKPMETLVDGQYAVVTFAVTGVDAEFKERELLFKSFAIDIDDGSVGGYSGNGGFYEEPIITDDGDEALEYVLSITAVGENLSGKKLSVAFQGLGTAGEKTEIADMISEGAWEFDIALTGSVDAVIYEPKITLDDPAFTVDSVRISPLTARIDYTVDTDVRSVDNQDDIPLLCTLKLRDGTVLEDIFGAGGYGFSDESHTHAHADCSLSQVIAPEEVVEIGLVVSSEFGQDAEVKYYKVKLQ